MEILPYKFMGMPYMFVIIPLAFLLNIAMVVVGAIDNDDPLCNGSYVLQVFGGFGIVICSILIVIYVVSRDDHAVPIFGIFHFIHLIVLIWASVLIFGKDPNNCSNTPTTFANVILILKWVTVPLDIIAQTIIFRRKPY